MCGNGVNEIEYLYFGIDEDHAWRFDHETEVNDARDAGFLPVSAPRHCEIKVESTAGGTASVVGEAVLGEPVVLKAEPGEKDFDGWYNGAGELLSRETEYSFRVEAPHTVYAVFRGEYFRDIAGQWYEDAANAAFEAELINGVDAARFAPNSPMTRFIMPGGDVQIKAVFQSKYLDQVVINQTVEHQTGNILHWDAVEEATAYVICRKQLLK